MSDEKPTAEAPKPEQSDEQIRHSEKWQELKKAEPYLPDHEITELARKG